MTTPTLPGGTFTLSGGPTLTRMGYGAMQLAGPQVFGPPADGPGAVTVLRTAVELGITHIDTADFYGPRMTNEIIREALHPYAPDLHIVTKYGSFRDAEGNWPQARSRDQLRRAVHDNLSYLGLDALDVVNLRVGAVDASTPGSIAEPFTALAELQQEGLITHLGVSTVSAEQVAEAHSIAPIVTVQNLYNIANRQDDALIDALAAQGHPLRAVFPAGRIHSAAVGCAQRCRTVPRGDPDGGGAGVAASAFAQHPAHPRHLVPRAPARQRGRCRTRAARRGSRIVEFGRRMTGHSNATPAFVSRVRITATASALSSTSTNRRPRDAATAPVVPEPAKK